MKKKLFSILLSLCMVLTMMPIATGTVWAADENQNVTPIEDVAFGYAYDVQRDPAYPIAGQMVELSRLTRPIVSSENKRGNSEGAWTLT